MERAGNVTRLLVSWRQGDAAARDELLPLVYDELRSLAASYLHQELPAHTLQATEIVHEAYLRLNRATRLDIKDRSHFFTVAAQAMRRLLVDHARRKHAGKRIGREDQVALDQVLPEGGRRSIPELAVEPDADVLAVHDAIELLSRIHPRQARLVELRYFGGLTMEEAAEVLEVSTPTLTRDWRVARVWLHRRLSPS